MPPERLVAKASAGTAVPAQCIWSAGSLTWAEGFIVKEKVSAGPVQLTPPFVNVGVTVIRADEGLVLLFIAVKAGILTVPLAARPIVGFEFVHA